MGLDITAYERVTLQRACSLEQITDQEHDEHLVLYVLDEFRAAADDVVDGVYDAGGESFGFRAGSYSGYNSWRRMLAALIGTTPEAIWANPVAGPFVELMNNADNEGVIGPETSAKLARDFAEWQERADSFAPEVGVHRDGTEMADYFRRGYANWRKAFELAANGGVVQLH